METGFLLSDFAQQLPRRNADVPDIYFNLLAAAGLRPILVVNQNAKYKKRKLGLLQNLNVRTWKSCTRKVVLLLGLYATQLKLAIFQYRR